MTNHADLAAKLADRVAPALLDKIVAEHRAAGTTPTQAEVLAEFDTRLAVALDAALNQFLDAPVAAA